jgi:hypothetical protein
MICRSEPQKSNAGIGCLPADFVSSEQTGLVWCVGVSQELGLISFDE